jgi:transcriptional regulator with XRE-family HTH domain
MPNKKPAKKDDAAVPEWEHSWSQMPEKQRERLLANAPQGWEEEWPKMSIEQKVKYFMATKEAKPKLLEMQALLKAQLSEMSKHQGNLLHILPPPEDGIGDRIKARREELRLNVEELARLTKQYDFSAGKGIAPSTIRRYEYKEGGFNPGAREICLLCDSLDVSADWLVRGISQNTDQAAQDAFNAFLEAVVKITASQDKVANKSRGQRSEYKETTEEREERLRMSKLPEK